MANNCFYEMKVWGMNPDDLKEFVARLNWENGVGFGRTFSADVFEEVKAENGVHSVMISGDCAWSIQSAYLDKGDMQSFCKDRNLIVEMYSSEIGCCFQEHYVIVLGIVSVDECTDYYELWLDDYAVENGDNSFETLVARYNEDNCTNFAPEDLDERDEIYCIGGFDEWHFYGCDEISSMLKDE